MLDRWGLNSTGRIYGVNKGYNGGVMGINGVKEGIKRGINRVNVALSKRYAGEC